MTVSSLSKEKFQATFTLMLAIRNINYLLLLMLGMCVCAGMAHCKMCIFIFILLWLCETNLDQVPINNHVKYSLLSSLQKRGSLTIKICKVKIGKINAIYNFSCSHYCAMSFSRFIAIFIVKISCCAFFALLILTILIISHDVN